MQMESYQKFHNEVGVPIVRIGCREFKCIGDKPARAGKEKPAGVNRRGYSPPLALEMNFST